MKRQPAGIPTGGEFAANEHDEASSSLPGGDDGLFDLLGTGDTMPVSQSYHTEGMDGVSGSLFRDYDGVMKLVAAHPSPLTGRAEEWAREHENQYEDFLYSEYDAEREPGTGRVVIENDVDEYGGASEAESIRNALLSDSMTHFARQVESGEFQRKVDEMVERDSIGSGGGTPPKPADEQELQDAIEDYHSGEISNISIPVAMSLARSFSKGTGMVMPKLDEFARTGRGSADALARELNRHFSRRLHSKPGEEFTGETRASDGESRRYLSLIGFLEGDRE